MIDMHRTLTNSFLLAVAASLLLAGCATTQTEATPEPEPKTEAAPEAVPAGPPPNLPTEAEIMEKYQGDGMNIPVDGSSLANFEASMDLVKQYADEPDFVTLENTIGYLLVYDLEVRRNKEKLAAKLDGLNGYEIVDKVKWRKPRPGKSKAEKGSADASFIDT